MTDKELLRRLRVVFDLLDTTTTALQHGKVEEGTAAALQAMTLLFAVMKELESPIEEPPQPQRAVELNSIAVRPHVVDRPAVVVILALEERRPQIVLTVRTNDDVHRLGDWLEQNEELADIFRAARELADPGGEDA